MTAIDLNCDMGEGMPNDAAIMPFISSANIACGYHAGDETTMMKTIELAVHHAVAIGAHPGFADKKNFGRIGQLLTPEGYYELVREQLKSIQKLVDNVGAKLHHVKPHGALYNMSAKDEALAITIARAVKDHDPNLILYGLSKSKSIIAAEQLQLKTCNEVFADRTYTDEGELTPRTEPAAIIHSRENALLQVLQMVTQQTLTSLNNKIVPVKADTICIHGDNANAAAFARSIFEMLQKKGIAIKPV